MTLSAASVTQEVDVLIVGGSYAGLSAAMALGRALRPVLVVDSGRPCNQQTPHSHNLLTQDGATPAHLAATAKAQVLAYPTVRFQADTVTRVEATATGFEAGTAAGARVRAKKILFATGIADQLPAIEGFAACWGISAIHCPYCHGYEYRHQPTGLLVNGPAALDFAQLIRNWTPNLTIFTNGTPTFSPEHAQRLQALGVGVESREIQELVHTQGQLESLAFTDGSRQPLQALYARVPFTQHCPLPQEMGCTLLESGHLQTDEFRRTTVPGVFAAGDNSSWMRSVAGGIAAGSAAGAFINHDLIGEGR